MKLRKAISYLRRRPRDFGVPPAHLVAPGAADYQRLGKEVDEALVRHDISVWFPRCVDTVKGGFTSGYSNTWQRLPRQTKGLMFHARMTWFTAQVSERMTGATAARFQGYALHGLKYLKEKLWDSKRGGFFWELSEDGTVPAGSPDEKYAYGTAFAVFACANVARVTGDREALELARQTFRWLEEHAHDPLNGGYEEKLSGDGKPLTQACSKMAQDMFGAPSRYKTTNAHIHLLEAFTELYRVWPDPLVRSRLEELFHIMRDTMFVLPGCMNQIYTADFRPVPGLDSYGHNVETAYLLVEAARVLGLPEDACTWERARLLVDNAIEHAFDRNLGGFYGEGPAFVHAPIFEKTWWAQAEALNELLYMHERFGAEDIRYWTAFVGTWRFICRYQLDSKYSGWHEKIWVDDKPLLGQKGHNWKAAYHTGRALLNVSGLLRRLAREEAPYLETQPADAN